MTRRPSYLIYLGGLAESRDRSRATRAPFELSSRRHRPRRTSPLEDHVTSWSARNPIDINAPADTFPPADNVANKLDLDRARGIRSRTGRRRRWK